MSGLFIPPVATTWVIRKTRRGIPARSMAIMRVLVFAGMSLPVGSWVPRLAISSVIAGWWVCPARLMVQVMEVG